MQKIRTATFEDLDAIAAVEAACFPAAEAATKEEFAGRLTHYADRFVFIAILCIKEYYIGIGKFACKVLIYFRI